MNCDAMESLINPPSKGNEGFHNMDEIKSVESLINPPTKAKKGFFNMKQVNAMESLINKLPETSEETLKTFPIDSFVTKLVNLIDETKDDAILRILAFTALVTVFQVLPSSYDALVKFDDGVASFFDVWTTINDETTPKTLAQKRKNKANKLVGEKSAELQKKEHVQMFLEALEKISKMNPTACLKAGALEAMLPLYNSSTDLKVAHSIAMNMSKEVPAAAAAKFVASVVPLLLKYLKDCDVKVVELALICLSETLKGFESSSDILGQIPCNHELVEEISKLICPHISGGGQASLNTSAWMALVFILQTCAKCSHLRSETFTKIVLIVKDLLTGAGVHPASSRPAPQILEIVKIANELLPPVPQDDSIRTKSSDRDKSLVEPKLLQHFGSNLLSPLIMICEDSVSSFVSRECLTVISKLMYFSSTSTIDSFSEWRRLSSFLAGVLAWKDPIVLSQAQKIANILMKKQPRIPSNILEREGVIQALRALKKPGSPGNSFTPLSSHVESSENSRLVIHLKDLCSQLTKVDNLSTTSEGSLDNDNEDYTLIYEILDDLSKGRDLSTFELVDSGVIDALLNYLSCGVYSKENITESLMVIYRKKAMKRWESFIAVALSSDFQDTKVAPMSILLKKLQIALSSLESFPVILTCDARTSCVNTHVLSGLSSLGGKINLRLCKAEGEKSLNDCSPNVVSFHPLKRIADVEEFLWPLVQGDECEERGDTHLAFFQGRNELTSDMSIYEVVQRFAVNEIETNKYNGQSRIWDDDAYNITYQIASLPTVIGSTSPSSDVDSSKQQMSIMDDILCGKLPFDLKTSNATHKILALLRLLEGLNKEFSHNQVRAESTCGDIAKEFINETLTSKLVEQISDTFALCSEILPSWCYQLTKACPFLFSFETRYLYFYLTALGHRRALYYLQQQQGVPVKNIYHGGFQPRRVSASRDCILDSASKILTNSNLEALITINFKGEVDPGLTSTKEFYSLISHDLQKVGLGMWRSDSPSNSRKASTTCDDLIQAPLGLFPCSQSVDALTFEKVLEHFELLGCVLAKALKDKRRFHMPLSLAFYKLLLGQDLNLHDIVSFDAELGQQLLEFQRIAEKGISETENSSHDYMLPDYPFEDNVDVNNLEKYVNHVVDITVRTGIGRQLNALRVGFSKVVDISTLQIFSPKELASMLCDPELSLSEIQEGLISGRGTYI